MRFEFDGNKGEILSRKAEIAAIKAAINEFAAITEAAITNQINNNFTSLSLTDKDILKNIAVTTRALSKAIKYMWEMMK